MRRQRGFTLIELAVTVVIVSIITYAGAEMYADWSRLQQRVERKQRLEAVATTLSNAALANASINAGLPGGSWFRVDATGMTHPVPTNTLLSTKQYVQEGGTYAMFLMYPAAQLDAVAGLYLGAYIPNGFTRTIFDDFGNNFVFGLSNAARTVTYRGHAISVPMMYVVSAGENGRFESTIAPTGLTLAGDDQVQYIDLSGPYSKAIDEAYDRGNKIKAALERFYQSRYLSDSSRAPTRNYFGKLPTNSITSDTIPWDSTSPMPQTSFNTPISADNSAILAALGLSTGDVTSPMAAPSQYSFFASNYTSPKILFSGTGVRDPIQGMSPPYSAQITLPLPFIASVPTTTAVSTF